MRKYLIHDILSKRVQLTDSLNSSFYRQLFQNQFKQRLLQIVTDNPPVYCLSNIQKYLASSSLPWYQDIPDNLKTKSLSESHWCENQDSSRLLLNFLDDLDHPLARFSQGAIWMEATASHINRGTGTSQAVGWMIFREEIKSYQGIVFIEFNRFRTTQIEMSSITTLPIDDSDRIIDSDKPSSVQVMCVESDMASLHSQSKAAVRLHLPLFALNVLRTKNGFSMPIEEQGRRQLASRIGIQNESGSYFFEVGPKMKHFVRGHIRVYTARQQTPLTVWVHPHTRGNRRPMLPDQHRRRSLQPSVGGSANALQCTEDG